MNWETIEKIFAVGALVIFVALVSMPYWMPKGCEVARPGYECSSFVDVMTESCTYLKGYLGHNRSEVQLRWYIEKLCNQQNQYHGSNYDCSDTASVCQNLIFEKLNSSVDIDA